MKKTKKNGFTLVELLVVIAILAVLASVSVVGYLSFVKKAKVSNDSSLITQMNTTLQGNEVEEGSNTVPYEAVMELFDSGLDVSKLSPTTEGYFYCYDINQNRMFLLDENYSKIAPENLNFTNKKDVFVFTGSEAEVTTANEKGYSTYLKNGFVFDDGNIETNKSIDVGENDISVKSITYYNESNSENEALIRTNSYSTSIGIYGPEDKVSHYGKAKEVKIAQVANNSYHEYGDILSNIYVAQGKVELEKDSKVSSVIIDSVTVTYKEEEKTVNPAASNLKINIDEEAEVNMIQSKNDNVEINDITEGSTDGVIVVESKIDANKVYCNGVLVNNLYNAIKKFNNDDPAVSDYKITLIQDISIEMKQPFMYSSSMQDYYDKNIILDLNGYKITQSNNDVDYAGTFVCWNGNNLEVRNGTIDYSTIGNEQAFEVKSKEKSSSLTLKNVTLNANGVCGVYAEGDANEVYSNLTIEDSIINAGTYGIATNASGDKGGVNVVIKNSTINSMNETSKTNSGILFNVNGSLSIENSTIKGNRQGVIVRGGTAKIKDSTISCDIGDTVNIDSTTWSSGNDLPEYPLVIGDTNTTNYNCDASCTLTNVKIENLSSNYNDRYVYLASDGTYKTTFNYDSSSVINNYKVQSGCKVIVNGSEVTGV